MQQFTQRLLRQLKVKIIQRLADMGQGLFLLRALQPFSQAAQRLIIQAATTDGLLQTQQCITLLLRINHLGLFKRLRHLWQRLEHRG